MKSLSFLIPALAFTTLQLSAQKSANIHEVPLGLQAENEATFNDLSMRADHDENKMNFINCWISPMDKTINSKYPEYTPVINATGNLMLFTSRRPENIGNRKTIDPTYKAEDIYFSTKDSEGRWSTANQVTGSINTFKNEAVT